MTNVRTFEQYNDDETPYFFKPGDYVIVTDNSQIKYNIVGVVDYARINIRVIHSDNEAKRWYQHNQIRLATAEEIELYKLEQDLNKYNL